MLTLKQLRDDKQLAIARLAKKGVDAAPIIDKIIELDDKRKAIQAELDDCLAEQNKAAKQIGALMGQGKREEAEQMKQQAAALKARSTELSAEHQSVSGELQSQIVLLPNFPAEIVPEGRTAEDNVVVKLVESPLALPENSYEALDGMVEHVEKIVASLGLPYRILRLCGGDMSFTSALTYDFEVYSEAQQRWL